MPTYMLEYFGIRTVKVQPIKANQVPEFLGQIIDIFEDFLEEKGIEIPNDEKEDSDNPAIIYGTDYDNLSNDLKGLMNAWGVTKRRW